MIGNNYPWHQTKHAERPTAISGFTGSERALSSVKNWIENCSQKHSCLTVKHTKLPTRLLDVRGLDQLSLHVSRIGEEGLYACLSHCWGDAPTLRTTSDNICQYQHSIAWDTLPKTFQDAITMISNLGIPYVWIDSLCIIQDMEADWQNESAKMADIYANATLTIAASLATSDKNHLFIEAQSAYQSTVLQEFDGSAVYVRKTLGHGHGDMPLPLLQRGWVLQERLLSPRVVHFTHEELIWECMEQTTCECGCIRSLWSPGHVPFDKDLLHEPILKRATRQDIKARWRQLAQEYSRLRLTLARDRLPAISGAARRLSPYINGEYLAGLWRVGLVTDLLWERKGSSLRHQNYAHVPSWSWLSIGAQIAYGECMTVDELGVVLSAKCTPLQPGDLFGEVSHGELQLVAALQPLSLFQGQHHVHPLSEGTAGALEAVFRDGVQVIFDCQDIVYPESETLCARLAIRRGVYRHWCDEEIWLLLAPVPLKDKAYHRIGILKMRHQDGCDVLHEAVCTEPQTLVLV